MPRSQNQKRKILYLMRILQEETDAAHPMPMERIIARLAKEDVLAERKSVYDDIETLRQFGLDIAYEKPGGYYLASRTFEIAELKLLVDSVQASQFITEKKTLALIKKLETLCSRFEAQLMRRQVYVSGRIKHMNESIYYSVDAIHASIAGDRQIRFRYFEYTVEKARAYRHDGAPYLVSPFALMWDNENYYLVGYDASADRIKHYRVDRMEGIETTEHPRVGGEAFAAHDMGAYTKRMFVMYGGREVRVCLEFANHLMGVVMDRFGKDVAVTKADETHFCIRAPVVVSPQFYAWMFGLGTEARIVSPADVAEGMQAQLSGVSALYAGGVTQEEA